jgi:hypothetical protein
MRSGAPIAASARPRRAAQPADLALPAIGAAAGEVAPPPRSWDRAEALEITDDLFEALYRNGVDVSWP